MICKRGKTASDRQATTNKLTTRAPPLPTNYQQIFALVSRTFSYCLGRGFEIPQLCGTFVSAPIASARSSSSSALRISAASVAASTRLHICTYASAYLYMVSSAAHQRLEHFTHAHKNASAQRKSL